MAGSREKQLAAHKKKNQAKDEVKSQQETPTMLAGQYFYELETVLMGVVLFMLATPAAIVESPRAGPECRKDRGTVGCKNQWFSYRVDHIER